MPRSASPQATVLSFLQARVIVEREAAKVRPGDTEPVELLAGGGRVLAQAVIADRDFPPFPRAARDGFAVRAADVSQVPAALKIVGEIRAGGPDTGISLRAGEAAEIMTGAPLPPEADAVVMVEYTERHDDRVEVQRSAAAGENFVPMGSEARRGATLL